MVSVARGTRNVEAVPLISRLMTAEPRGGLTNRIHSYLAVATFIFHYLLFRHTLSYDFINLDDQALHANLKAIKLDSGNTWTYNNLGVIHEHKKDFRKAIEAYRTAIKLDPDLKEAFKIWPPSSKNNIPNFVRDIAFRG